MPLPHNIHTGEQDMVKKKALGAQVSSFITLFPLGRFLSTGCFAFEKS